MLDVLNLMQNLYIGQFKFVLQFFTKKYSKQSTFQYLFLMNQRLFHMQWQIVNNAFEI